jgi:hypothetical protein
MVDFRTLAVELSMADGKIDEPEVKVLRKHLADDGVIQQKELIFLTEIRAMAQRKLKSGVSAAFEKFFFDAFLVALTANKTISKKEVALLRTSVFTNKKADASEKAFLQKLKAKAVKDGIKLDATFDKLYAEVVG